MKKVYIETHGCQMNVHDTEKAANALAQAGYESVSDPLGADLVLLNTCMVREKPEQKVFQRISSLKSAQAHATGHSATFGVMGCVAQAEAERIFARSKEVSLVVGTQSIGKITHLVEQLEQGFPRAIDVTLTKDADFYELDAARRQNPQIAYISIIEGCNKFCSYCIVPFTRGRERSRPADRILAEAQALARAGYREVHLLGQNVNSYGLSGKYRGSLPGKFGPAVTGEITFAALLELLAKESGIPRIKYTTSYPRDFDKELLRIMDQYESLCEWIHLPAQSGSDRVLKKMRRGYTKNDYLTKINFIKAARKDYAITGDIIVGFPGETEEDFLETMQLVTEVEYDGLYIFNYSPRPNTAALSYGDTVTDEVKTERLMRLVELQSRIQRRRYERYLGRTVEVLVEGESAKSDTKFTGHSRCQKTVNFPKANSRLGEIVKVKINQIGKNSLNGEIVGVLSE
ncbi:MAG: tRNA (N6-isopentenyl adenosine(37)-C2)-methylthiotransferase MiaB [Blastocatellia bacterium]